jgi:hypothetical protein
MTQFFEIIFGDLRSSKKSVNRLLSIGILFALLGHFFVVEPYFPFKAQEHKQTKLRDNVIAIKKSILDTLDTVEFQIETYPAHLGQVRQKVYDAIWLEPSSEPLPVGRITIPADTEFKDGMRYYVENWFSNLLDELNNGIVIKVSERQNGNEELETFNNEIEAKKAMERFKAGLDRLETDNPEILTNYEGNKGDEATALLQRNLETAYAPLKFNVSGLLKRTEDRLTEINEGINELETRIGSLESPLGPIPVGLTDFVTLFPLVIVTLVVMVTVALHKSCRLFMAFRREGAKDDTPVDSETFHQLADCWYFPPYPSIVHRWLLSVLVAIGTYIYLRASYLIIMKYLLADHDIQTLTRNVFIFAYGVGILVIVACTWFAWKTIRSVPEASMR